MFQQKCMICGESATHKFTKIVGGEAKEYFYCTQHADERNAYVKKPDLHMQNVINAMLKNLLSGQMEEGAGKDSSYP